MSDLFLKVLNMSISAGWLIAAVLAFRIIFQKAPKQIRMLLWAIVAVRLVCPVSLESVLSLIPSAETVSPEIMMSPQPEISSGVLVIDNTVNPVISHSFAPEPADSANPLQIWIPILSGIWIAGIVALLAYAVISYWSLRRRVSTAVRLQDNIYQSENTAFPFVMGVLQPKVYLPFKLNEQDMHYVIAHERAHIKRRDYWWKPLGFLLMTVYWFNPLMWLSYILFCRDIELACDEKVVNTMEDSDKAAYAQALLNCSIPHRMNLSCPLAFGEVGVKQRVKSVLNYKKPAFWIMCSAVVILIVVAVCFLTNPKTEPEISDMVDENGVTEPAISAGDFGNNFLYYTSWYGIVITRYFGEDTTVIIPQTVVNQPVIMITDNAFANHSDIERVTIPDSVIFIGDSAFQNCVLLENIELSANVIYIGNNAFYGCDNLMVTYKGQEYTSANFEDLYDLFDGVEVSTVLEESEPQVTDTMNENVKIYEGNFEYLYDEELGGIVITKYIGEGGNVVIPETIDGYPVVKIGHWAFRNLDNLTNISIPDSVTSIEEYAFLNCSNLTDINIPNSMVSIDNGVFKGCSSLSAITIPDNITSIGNYAFEDCDSLINVTIPDSVTTIGACAFYKCDGLTNITIPGSVTSIGDYAFHLCHNLTDVILPDSITYLGAEAFRACTSLTSIIIPDSITSINEGTFWGCSNLADITIPDSVTSIGHFAFRGCSSLSAISIPDGVIYIGEDAFKDCTILTDITIPDGVTSIWGWTFDNCGNLTNIIIPDSVTIIRKYAFRDCIGLTNITIPDNVTWIGEGVFDGCRNLTVIYKGQKYTSANFEDLYDLFDGVAVPTVLDEME